LINKDRLNGVIPIHKPAGMTSHDVVARLRKIIGIKKIGHAGTLDPEVTGVLPVCIGKATRITEYMMELPKTYQGELTLGISTTTQDFTGEVVEDRKVKELKKEQVEEVFRSFTGEIEQIPPMYSSVKIKGKKLYELARKGEEIERKPRKVTIYELKFLHLDSKKDYPTIDFIVTSSKGTYVRTLCVDIGKRLGYPAHMSKLSRIKSSGFTIDQSYSLEEIEQLVRLDKLETILISMAEALPQYAEVVLPEKDLKEKVWNGQRIAFHTHQLYDGIIKVTDKNRKLYALYEKKKHQVFAYPKKVFK